MPACDLITSEIKLTLNLKACHIHLLREITDTGYIGLMYLVYVRQTARTSTSCSMETHLEASEPLTTLWSQRQRRESTFTHFTVKRETQRLGHNHSVGCVLVSTSYTDHALHVVEQSHSPMTLKTPYFPPCDWTFPGEFRPGMYSWWRSNCNSCEGKSLSNERRGNAGEALSLTIACSQQFADQNAYSGMHGLVVVVIYGTIWGVCAFHSGLQSSNECSHQAPSLRLVIPGKLWAEFKVRSKAVVHCKKELVVCFNFEKLVSGLP